ncbi:carboxylate--amine ligase [bacterium]|nr:carboxylate--amine ligase [bacterium]
MNFLMPSPSYPPRVFFFAKRLQEAGFNVFGMGDAPYAGLNAELKSALKSYVVQPLDCYDPNGGILENAYRPIRRKVEQLVRRHGKMTFVESFNEWWLPLDARLRQDFDMEGLRPDELEGLIKKSRMKETFRKAGAATVRGEIVRDEASVHDFLREIGSDIIAKPDRGLGSAHTFRLKTDADVAKFWQQRKPGAIYFMEKFIQGEDRQFMSFDGLADRDGAVVFHTAHVYNDGDFEIATTGKTIYYHNLRRDEIPPKFREVGLSAVRAFNVRKRFFHIEFFRIGEDYYGVEINARPPGFVHLDMMNYASGIDIWSIYAKVMKDEKVIVQPACDKVCMQIGRFKRIRYRRSVEEILKKYGSHVAGQFTLGVDLYGDDVLLVLTDDHQKRREILDFATLALG